MFVPSKQQFPIAPTKLPNYMQPDFCGVCNRRWLSNSQTQSGKTYQIIKWYNPNSIIATKILQEVCSGCQRWTNFDYWTFLNSLGWKRLPDNKVGWQALRREIFDTVLPSHISLYLYKWYRRKRFEVVNKYNWHQYFSSAEIEWLKTQIKEMTKNLDYTNNIRVAKVGKNKQVKSYWKQAAEGCCGAKDIVRFRIWNLSTYLIGCNYGH